MPILYIRIVYNTVIAQMNNQSCVVKRRRRHVRKKDRLSDEVGAESEKGSIWAEARRDAKKRTLKWTKKKGVCNEAMSMNERDIEPRSRRFSVLDSTSSSVEPTIAIKG